MEKAKKIQITWINHMKQVPMGDPNVVAEYDGIEPKEGANNFDEALERLNAISPKFDKVFFGGRMRQYGTLQQLGFNPDEFIECNWFSDEEMFTDAETPLGSGLCWDPFIKGLAELYEQCEAGDEVLFSCSRLHSALVSYKLMQQLALSGHDKALSDMFAEMGGPVCHMNHLWFANLVGNGVDFLQQLGTTTVVFDGQDFKLVK